MDLGGSQDAGKPANGGGEFRRGRGALRVRQRAARRRHAGFRGGADHRGAGLRDVPDDDVQAAPHCLTCCCVLGYILEICGTLTLIGGPTARNIRKFSVLYVCGNLIAIMATAFWVGPKLMCKKMWNSTRRGATAMYLVSLVLVLVLALLHVAVFVVLLMLAVELFCAVWYTRVLRAEGAVVRQQEHVFSPCPCGAKIRWFCGWPCSLLTTVRVNPVGRRDPVPTV